MCAVDILIMCAKFWTIFSIFSSFTLWIMMIWNVPKRETVHGLRKENQFRMQFESESKQKEKSIFCILYVCFGFVASLKTYKHLNHFRCEINLPSVDHFEVVDKCKRCTFFQRAKLSANDLGVIYQSVKSNAIIWKYRSVLHELTKRRKKGIV